MTFNQVTWTHILVVGFYLLKLWVIYPLFSSLSPRHTFWLHIRYFIMIIMVLILMTMIINIMIISLLSLSTLLENVAVPTYWFYSSYINFNELWSSVNVFYR